MPKRASECASLVKLKDCITLGFDIKAAKERKRFFDCNPGYSVRKILALETNDSAMNAAVAHLGEELGSPTLARATEAFRLADQHLGYQIAGSTQADGEHYRQDAKLFVEFLRRRGRNLRRSLRPKRATKPKKQSRVKKMIRGDAMPGRCMRMALNLKAEPVQPIKEAAPSTDPSFETPPSKRIRGKSPEWCASESVPTRMPTRMPVMIVVKKEQGANEDAIPSASVKEEQAIPSASAKEEQAIPSAKVEEEQAIPSVEVEEEQAIPSVEVEEEQAIPSVEVEEEQAIPSAKVEEEQGIPSAKVEEEQAIPSAKVEEEQVIPSASVKEEQAIPSAAKEVQKEEHMSDGGSADSDSKSDSDSSESEERDASSGEPAVDDQVDEPSEKNEAKVVDTLPDAGQVLPSDAESSPGVWGNSSNNEGIAAQEELHAAIANSEAAVQTTGMFAHEVRCPIIRSLWANAAPPGHVNPPAVEFVRVKGTLGRITGTDRHRQGQTGIDRQGQTDRDSQGQTGTDRHRKGWCLYIYIYIYI